MLVVMLFTSSYAVAQKRRKADKKQEETSKKKSDEDVTIATGSHFIEGEKFFLLKDYPKALEQFSKVLELDPANAAANYKKAQIHAELEENIEALPHAIKAKQLNPKNKYYYILLANIYTNLADLEMAANTYADLIANVPDTQNYLFDLAALQLYQKKYDDALQTYIKAQEHYGIMDEIIYQKQKIYLRQNKLDLAIAEGKLLIESNPGVPEYVASLSKILISNNQSEKAKTYLEEYITTYGEDPVIGVQLAEIYRKAGQVKEAILMLRAAFANTAMDLAAKVSTLEGYMAMLPNQELVQPLIELANGLLAAHPDAYQSFAATGDLYLSTGNKQKAREYYLQAIEISASNYNIWQNIISIELDLKAYDSAIEHAEQALEYFPNQAGLYYLGGTANLLNKKYENAIQLFETGKMYTAANKQLSSVLNGQLGDAYNSLGQHEKSDNAYEEALKLNPENDHVLNNYSYFLSLRKENLDKAEQMSSKLVTLKKDNPTYLDTHGWVLYIRKKYKEARVFLEKAAQNNNNPTIIEHYGDVLFQLGAVNEAIIQWKKARDLAPDKENLNKKIADKQLYE